MAEETESCQFCNVAKMRYVCPKCNAPYCSVACYKAPAHLKCSEAFYKSCIMEELNTEAGSSREDVRKIYDILKRINNADKNFKPTDFDAEELDKPLDSDDDNNDGHDDILCYETEDDVADISERLQGVNINNSEEVWARLTVAEQLEFQKLIDNGEIMKLLPNHKPWWCKGQNSKITVLNDKNTNMPKICDNIKKFTDLCKKLPSPCLHYNLWNILSAYTCIVRFFSGEQHTNPSEATAHLVNLSATLKYGTNFEDADDAIKSVEMEALTTRTSNADANLAGSNLLVENREQLQQDARQLMLTRENKLAALSDILNLLILAKQEVKSIKVKEADFQKLYALCTGSIELNNVKLKQLIKKMEFMLSYVNRDCLE